MSCYFWTFVTLSRETAHLIFLLVGTKRKCLRLSDTKRFNFSSTTNLLEVWMLSNIPNAFHVSCSFWMGAGKMKLSHPESQPLKDRGLKARDCTGVMCLTQCSYRSRWRMASTPSPKTQKVVQSLKPKGGEKRSEIGGNLIKPIDQEIFIEWLKCV